MSEAQISAQELHSLELYKMVSEGKVLNQKITLEDLTAIKELTEVMPQLEEEAKPVFEQIEEKARQIEALSSEIAELEKSIDVRLRYLKSQPQPITPPKTNNHTVKEEFKDITTESIMEILRQNPYGLGNSEIAKRLNHTDSSSKAEQNKVYTVCKKLESEGKIKSENRLWKVI